MECVKLRRKGVRSQFLALDVPGLAERRPSLVHGDHVFVKHAAGSVGDNTVYRVCCLSWNILFSQKSL